MLLVIAAAVLSVVEESMQEETLCDSGGRAAAFSASPWMGAGSVVMVVEVLLWTSELE